MLLVFLKVLTNLSFITISKIVGIFSTIFAVVAASIYVYKDTKYNPIQSLFLPLSFISIPVVCFHAVNGMDTGLHMAFITLVSIFFLLSWDNKKYLTHYFIFTLFAFLVRYESVLSSSVLFLSLFYQHRNNKNEYIIKSLLCFIIPGLIYFSWKLYYFGGIFPNSFYVKTSETLISPSGLSYLINNYSRFFAIGSIGFLCLFPYSKTINKNRYFVLSIALYLQILFIIRIIPTVGQGGRFVFPYIPTFLMIISIVVVGTSMQNRKDTLINKLLLIVTLGFLFIGTHLDSRRGHFRHMRNVASTRVYDPIIGKAFQNIIDNPEDIVISTGESGAISYFTDFTLVDIWGLHDAHIAKNGIDPDYVFSHNPDIFATFIPKGVVTTNENGDTVLDRDYMRDYVITCLKRKDVKGNTAYSSFIIMMDERFDNYKLLKSIGIGSGKEWVFLIKKDSQYYFELESRIRRIEFSKEIDKVKESMTLKRYLKAFLSPFDKNNYTLIDIFFDK